MISELRGCLVRELAPLTVTASVGIGTRDRLAKVVIWRDGDAYPLAVLPAAAPFDLAGFRRRIGRYGLVLGSQDEFRAEFPEFAAGPLPPFRRMAATLVYLDRAFAEETAMRLESDHGREVVSAPMRVSVRVERQTLAPLAQGLRAA